MIAPRGYWTSGWGQAFARRSAYPQSQLKGQFISPRKDRAHLRRYSQGFSLWPCITADSSYGRYRWHRPLGSVQDWKASRVSHMKYCSRPLPHVDKAARFWKGSGSSMHCPSPHDHWFGGQTRSSHSLLTISSGQFSSFLNCSSSLQSRQSNSPSRKNWSGIHIPFIHRYSSLWSHRFISNRSQCSSSTPDMHCCTPSQISRQSRHNTPESHPTLS